MASPAPRQTEQLRAAEIAAALSLATDLGMGFPFEHGLHATLVACHLGDLLGVDQETSMQTYYACLLMYSGCTTDGEDIARIFGSSLTDNHTRVQFGSFGESLGGIMRALPPPDTAPALRPYEVMRRLPAAARFKKAHFASICEVATMVAEQLGLPASVQDLFGLLTERWDGKGTLRRAEGDEIPLALRIVHVARDATYQHLFTDAAQVARVIGDRAGAAFDPRVARCFAESAGDVLAAADAGGSVWDAVLAIEPRPWLTLESEAIDRALAAIGHFSDLSSPSLSGHSAGVARLTSAAARVAGFDAVDTDLGRRAALIHDVGRVAVDPRIWGKTGPLSADQLEQVRLHPYHSERVLVRSPFLAELAEIASNHHEHLDGSGYHRGVAASMLPPLSRLLASADTFRAMSENRPHRDPLSPEDAARALSEEARQGRHDAEMVAAVLTAAGEPSPRLERPKGLTEREAEVLGLVARGLQTKQIARALGISPKTADRHIQNTYRKIEVSTRAGATLFAMDHGLVPWGELPMHT